MRIIPAINCQDFDCVKEKLLKAAEFSDWAQIDIADGKFTQYENGGSNFLSSHRADKKNAIDDSGGNVPKSAASKKLGEDSRHFSTGFTGYTTWNNPQELKEFLIKNPEFKIKNIEVHLMVEHPTEAMIPWMAFANRIILHVETLSPSDFIMSPEDKRFEIGLAINPDTDIQKVIPRLSKIKFVQILAVLPGKAGQKLDERVLEKITFLKKNYPDVILEVDGGINLETAKICKEAGADIIASASYIFDSGDPEKAYRALELI